MPTPDRRPRGHNRRAQQRRQDESQGSLLHRINAATLPLRQRIGQGMSGLGQRGQEAKTGKFKLASPLPRKHTIGLLILIPLWLLVLAWEPTVPAPKAAPSGSLAVPIAVPAQALTVGNGTTGSAPVRSQTGRREGGWHLAAARRASRRDPLLHLPQVRAAGRRAQPPDRHRRA